MMEHPSWPRPLVEYSKTGFTQVKGWVNGAVLDSLAAVHECQNKNQAAGSIGEIGVYHGRFFLALDCLRADGEISAAFDIFDDQGANIDSSGSGASLNAFLKNVSLFSSSPDKVVYRQCDSFTMNASDIFAPVQGKKFKLFSVDGGHTVEHTMNDLRLAEQVIAPKGIVILDDYYNPMWPGVHEGFVRFMSTMNCRLAPFAYHANKLFLTLMTHHQEYLSGYSAIMEKKLGYQFKLVKMSGFTVASVFKPAA